MSQDSSASLIKIYHLIYNQVIFVSDEKQAVLHSFTELELRGRFKYFRFVLRGLDHGLLIFQARTLKLLVN